MSYRLVVTEKPSVAMSIAAALGAESRKDGYMEGGGWLISWCVGHLAELAVAETYDPKYAKWRREDLPILPESWRFTIGKDKRGQFDTLRTLLRREDVSEVVNACDAGREGELIFRTAYHLAGCDKPMKRLWISSIEDSAIREGFDQLKPGMDYDGLHQAALCRSKADWLVGINATRLFSVLYGRTLNIGRVVSPTLALIVQREANRTLGYTAQQTLDYLQALYEKKLCTYPRTDSRFLTDDMENSVPALVSAAAAVCGLDTPGEVLASQVCNSKKVTDHHAIVPTGSAAATDLSALPLGEREVLRLVSLALLRAVCPPYRYAETSVAVECAGHSFSAKGKVLLDAGWRAYAELPQDAALPDGLTEGMTLAVEAVRVKEGKTAPPKHFTEDTILIVWRPPGPGICLTMRSGAALALPPPAPGFWRSWWSPGWWSERKPRRSPTFCPPRRAAPSSLLRRRPCNPPCSPPNGNSG